AVGELLLDELGDLAAGVAGDLHVLDPREPDRAVLAHLVLAAQLLLIGDADLDDVAVAERLAGGGGGHRQHGRRRGTTRRRGEQHHGEPCTEARHIRTAPRSITTWRVNPPRSTTPLVYSTSKSVLSTATSYCSATAHTRPSGCSTLALRLNTTSRRW